MSQCCGRPRLSEQWRQALREKRTAYLRQHGPQMAATFDSIYGYGASNGCGRNVSYYDQFEASNGEHCTDQVSKESHEAQIDRYRGLDCTHLCGWDKRRQEAQASCCSFPGSCNGTLPYPYAQAQLGNCDPNYARFAQPGCAACGAQRPRYVWALDQPKQYATSPYPVSYYMPGNLWPYGEHAPTEQELATLQQTNVRCAPASCNTNHART